jgi:ribosome biogenesis protein MAK21
MEDEGIGSWRWWKIPLPPLEPVTPVTTTTTRTETATKSKVVSFPVAPTTTTTPSLFEMKNKAQKLLEKEAEKSKSKASPKDEKWLRTVLHSGTVSDRAAATRILFQENPYNLKAFDSILAMARKKGRREAQMGFDSLKELFISHLLPYRALVLFKDQPYAHPKVTETHLVQWLYEEEIKQRYAQFLGLLEATSHDTVLHSREISVRVLADLVQARPQEQASVILASLVNKLGDPEKKLASKICYHLTCVIKKKEVLRSPIAKELEIFLARSNLTIHAQYYAAIVLNQMILKRGEKELPNKLITVYFSLFKTLHDKGEIEAKILTALLSGVNRAFPYASLPDEIYEEHFDLLFKIVHVTTFNKAMQALLLLFQVLSHRRSISTRFYRALYDKMLSPDLYTSSRQNLFFHILFKSLKEDYSLPRIRAFFKRLLQVSFCQNAGFSCAALMLISELLKQKPLLWTLLTQPEDHGDDEEHFVDQPIRRNNESSNKNKRENTTEGEQSDEDMKMSSKLTFGNGSTQDSDQDEVEEVEEERPPKKATKPVTTKKPSGVVGVGSEQKFKYDARKRDPEFCNADRACLWELVDLVITPLLPSSLTGNSPFVSTLSFPSSCLFVCLVVCTDNTFESFPSVSGEVCQHSDWRIGD